ncbi:alkyl hydroperoxide reductase [Carboxydothermus islandicus]|uniref:Bacterioferritin comigratory protein n=1 Tax=Carboxydothermus islandicus TaxID=661089 RepID=A0A1L8D098_9THEO|nr:alkyl hydroperoxide reductase [Carboxydothermus islandicus]
MNFKAKYNLPFELLSDPTGEVLESYGVLKEKKMYGKSALGIERSTFVIAPDRTILQIYRNVKVDGHAEEILKFLQQVEES